MIVLTVFHLGGGRVVVLNIEEHCNSNQETDRYDRFRVQIPQDMED